MHVCLNCLACRSPLSALPSPGRIFHGAKPGERRGSYRSSLETPVLDEQGQPGRISTADLAVAIVDELEQRQHIRRRFTVGY